MPEVSVRFYVESKASQEQVQAVVELKKDGKLTTKGNERYFEFKVEKHFMNLHEEFVSEEFCLLIRPITEKITLITKDYGFESMAYPMFKIGSTKISYDNYSIMIKGKNLLSVIKMFHIFKKHGGKMGEYSEEARRRQATEIELHESRALRMLYENSYKDAEKLIESLNGQIEVLKQKQQVEVPAKWKFWLWDLKLSSK